MDIVFLKKLQDNPIKYGFTKNSPIISISAQEITQLEQLYNAGNPFPKALKELLYLAGKRCYVLDYGLNETQQELQEFVRTNLDEDEKVINRPFFAIDVYNAGDQFLFVYLDAEDDPAVYEGYYWDESSNWIKLINPYLSSYIDGLIERVKAGQNPF